MSQDQIPPEERQPPEQVLPAEETPAEETPAQGEPAGEEGEDQENQEKKKRPGSFGANVYGWLQALTFALVTLLVLFTFVGRLIGVDGHSMDPTLNDQDMLFIQSIGYTPEQGDIVVLHKDFGDITYPIVKRVIAVGGQTVEIDYDTSTVYVDGEPLDEPYILEPMEAPAPGDYKYGTYWEVPEGCVFVMGDNRNHSSDSRDYRLGPVEEEYILGKAIAIVLPFQHTGLVD